MFNISFAELMVILLLAFLILGPKEMGKIARFLGKAVRKSRRLLYEIKGFVNDEVEDAGLKDVKDAVSEVKTAAADVKNTVSSQNPVNEIKKELGSDPSATKK